MKEKYCTKCCEFKPVDEFYKQKSSKDGLGSNCKCCRKLYNEENKEKIRKAKKAHYEANKDRLNKESRKYHSDNKEMISEAHKKYYKLNKEEINRKNKIYNKLNAQRNVDRVRLWRIENPEKKRNLDRSRIETKNFWNALKVVDAVSNSDL